MPETAAAKPKKTAKPKGPKPWRATVNLDRLDPATGHWRITTGPGKDPLPRVVATDPAVFAAITGWLTAHRAKKQPAPEETAALDDAIRTSVTAAFRAMPPADLAALTPTPRVK
jgi:hypothetical protein